ncbi:MAG: CBS domain-containing protein [Chloroflexota bacterium]
MQVKDVMIPVVGSVEPDTLLRDAAETMKALNLNPLPVCDDEGVVVGILTEQALVDHAESAGLAVGSQKVSEAMSTDISCCFADEEIADALSHMDERATARMPVIARDHTLVGIVSLEDMRKKEQVVAGEVTAAGGVESISELVQFQDDQVDFMSDSSFPASDPIPPPTSLGSEEEERDGRGSAR